MANGNGARDSGLTEGLGDCGVPSREVGFRACERVTIRDIQHRSRLNLVRKLSRLIRDASILSWTPPHCGVAMAIFAANRHLPSPLDAPSTPAFSLFFAAMRHPSASFSPLHPPCSQQSLVALLRHPLGLLAVASRTNAQVQPWARLHGRPLGDAASRVSPPPPLAARASWLAARQRIDAQSTAICASQQLQTYERAARLVLRQRALRARSSPRHAVCRRCHDHILSTAAEVTCSRLELHRLLDDISHRHDHPMHDARKVSSARHGGCRRARVPNQLA